MVLPGAYGGKKANCSIFKSWDYINNSMTDTVIYPSLQQWKIKLKRSNVAELTAILRRHHWGMWKNYKAPDSQTCHITLIPTEPDLVESHTSQVLRKVSFKMTWFHCPHLAFQCSGNYTCVSQVHYVNIQPRHQHVHFS